MAGKGSMLFIYLVALSAVTGATGPKPGQITLTK